VSGEFLKCEFNRDGDSYRSPISNKYWPALSDGRKPGNELRELEIKFNKMFPHYAKNYYGNQAICSVFLTEIGEKIEEGFIATILIKNSIESKKEVEKGAWDSINFVNVEFHKEGDKIKVNYKLTLTIILQMSFKHPVCGHVDLSGTLTKQTTYDAIAKTYLDHQFHIEKIGNMVEELETMMRSQIEEVYFKKTQEILDTSRFSPITGKPNIEGAKILKEVFFEGKNK